MVYPKNWGVVYEISDELTIAFLLSAEVAAAATLDPVASVTSRLAETIPEKWMPDLRGSKQISNKSDPKFVEKSFRFSDDGITV